MPGRLLRHFVGSGGALCTLARSPEPVAVLMVPLIPAKPCLRFTLRKTAVEPKESH